MSNLLIEIIKFLSEIYRADGMTNFIIVTALTINLIFNVVLIYVIYKMDKASRLKDEKYLNLYTEGIVPLVSMIKTLWFVKHKQDYDSYTQNEEGD